MSRKYLTPAAIDDRIFCTQLRLFADVAELADALDSGSSDSNILWVQVPSSAPKSRHRHKAVPAFLYDAGLNPPKQGSPKKRSFFGEEEQQRSLRRKSRKAGFFAMRSLLRRKSHHPHQKADTAARRCLFFYMMRAVFFRRCSKNFCGLHFAPLL